MGVVLVVVGIAIVFLLWRILRVQEVRARVEVAQVTAQVARDLGEAIAKGWEDARARGRLIEWLDDVVRMLDANEDEMHLRLHSSAGKELRPLLVSESLERGVRCRFLDERDFQDRYPGHPGPEPKPYAWCPTNCCDQERDLTLPAELKVCPFCGEPADAMEVDDEQQQWKADMQAFERYRKLFPTKANADEAQSVAAHAAAGKRDREKYDAAIAAHRAKEPM